MVDMGIDNIVNHDRDIFHARILIAWNDYWESDILIKRDQENEQLLLKKYKNLRFLDDEENQTYIIAPENLEFKVPTINNNKYCVVRHPLNWRYGDNVDLLVSRYINDYCILIIKVVE